MHTKELINTFFLIKKQYRNYIGILFTLYAKRKTSHIKDVNFSVFLRDGEELTVPYGRVTAFVRLNNIKNSNISEIKLTNDGISFKYKEVPILLDPARYSDPDAVFFYEEYKFLNVKDRDVIDIGMNIGDSALYFSINGAKRVIGLEPYPYAFSFAEKNVKLNSVNNIILLNAGYGKDSNIIIDQGKFSSNGSTLISSVKGKNIPIFSLKTLIDKYNIKNGILKMDCEGCEYALLEEDDKVLNNIEMIQIEYHYGCENLVKKLRNCSFYVEYTEPRNSYNPNAENQI
ncbi:FkbM family methyltransferase [Cuniculiplasma divulgatum]|uniref:SAM-dependent methyltransferase n=1 Tax=Cuniculiplasma divulgatum TaxID=1673428 RepID=A0A1N5UK75_9ARCH|nr:FkbM family methyltransferase [Cuniculiplasma divulgatum]SIM61091.1 SAM-dependent methyltransferase [Cuniculiplasma divulgatum]SJK84847.1 SAM-dependent methyltransferase [Cuniculiplasma divulgatum]